MIINNKRIPQNFSDRRKYTDSDEEVYFSWWLDELQAAGLIERYTYNEDVFLLSDKVDNTYQEQLKTKVKDKSENLIKKHIYTPDFAIYWNDKAKGIFFGEGKQSNYPFILVKDSISYVETKGDFDFNNMTRLFTVNQKWLYDKEKTYINLLKISSKKNSFFDKTFTPKMYTIANKSKQKRKLHYKPKILNSYLTQYRKANKL